MLTARDWWLTLPLRGGAFPMRGRPPKPIALRLIEGRRVPKRDALECRGRPEPPAHLTADQRSRWDELVASLPDGLLTAADVSTLERMAIAWSTYREAQGKINLSGLLTRGEDGQPVRNPLLIIRKQAAEEMNLCGAALGLSPAARVRLQHPAASGEDPLDILFGPHEQPAAN
jgi:P27 family predicted phage terminase small subunit